MYYFRESLQGGSEFTDALAEHLDALVERDIETFVATLDDDVVNVGPHGERTVGKMAVGEAHAAWFAPPAAWKFAYSVLQLRSSETSGLALLDVRYNETSDSPENRFLLSLLFERRSDDRWFLIYDQNTPITG